MIRKEDIAAEIIKATKNPELEHRYAKFPGKPLEDVSYRSTERSTDIDTVKLNRLKKKFGANQYTDIHTHPVHDYEEFRPMDLSKADIKTFLEGEDIKSFVVAMRGEKDGEPYGSLSVRKTKKTRELLEKMPQEDRDAAIREAISQYGEDRRLTEFETRTNQEVYSDALDKLAKKFNLQVKYSVVKGHKFDFKNGIYSPNYKPSISTRAEREEIMGLMREPPSRDNSKLERIAALFVISSIMSFVFFLSSDITGNVIGYEGIINMKAGLAGLIIFILSLIGLFFIKFLKHTR